MPELRGRVETFIKTMCSCFQSSAAPIVTFSCCLAVNIAAWVFWAVAVLFDLLSQAVSPCPFRTWTAAISRFGRPLATGVSARLPPTLAVLVGPLLTAVAFFIRIFSSDRIRLVEGGRERDRATHEAGLQGRQQAAEARADRVFSDLEKGMRFEDLLAEGSSSVGRPSDEAVCVKIVFSSDLILPSRHVLDVFVFRLSALALELRALFCGQRRDRNNTMSGLGYLRSPTMRWIICPALWRRSSFCLFS